MTQEDKTSVWQDWIERVSLEEVRVATFDLRRVSEYARRVYGIDVTEQDIKTLRGEGDES